MLAIGVGCYWFAQRAEEDDSFNPREFLEQVQGALEGVDNVSEVEIVTRGDSISVSGSSYAADGESDNFFPIFSNVRISFDIFLPERLIEKYGLGFATVEAEHFHVAIVCGGAMPVAYVSYELPDDAENLNDYRPSGTVVAVREYLKEKLSSHPSVEFRFLGPSPFHADFFALSSQNTSMGKDVSKPSRGYRTFSYEFVAEEDELLGNFIELNHRILETYYMLARYRSRSIHFNSIIVESTRELVDESGGRGVFGIRRWFRQGPVIDEIFAAILADKLNRASTSTFISEAKGEDIREDNALYALLDHKLLDVSPAPTDEVKEILKLMEDRRQGYIRNTTTVGSGLLGGITGALLTFLLGLYLGHSRAPVAEASPSKAAPIEAPSSKAPNEAPASQPPATPPAR